MKPLEQLAPSQAATIHTLLTDIDDTITTDGRLRADAYSALEAVHHAGLRVVVTTGRPAGWCDHIARMWPVDAVVGENGAFYCWYDRKQRKLNTQHSLTPEELVQNRSRIQAVADQVLREVAGSALASDQFCRLYDLAIDFCEDVTPLDRAAVANIVQIMQASGMTAKVSSIHVNGWFGQNDKLSMATRLMQELYGIDLDVERARIAYIGDSPNDAPMFAHFPCAVGVANVFDFVGQIESLPQYVTTGRSGAGFMELAALLTRDRNPGLLHC